MKLVQGMLLAAMMLAMAGGAGAVEKAADAAAGVGGGNVGGMPMPASGSGMSGDDEWACKVAMCMANPGGPTEFAECVDPINRLRRHLAKGRAFPVCRFIGGGDGQQGNGSGSRSGGGRVDKEHDPLQAL